MNERDSEAVTGLLLQNGWEIVESAEKADAALLNTCSVRDHAERRVMGWLNKMQHLKLTRPGLVVGILGCMAQLRQKTFFEASPAVDVVCGPGNLKELPKLLAKAAAKRQRQVLAVDRLGEAYGLDGIEYRRNRVRALVTIMTGCDNACTYCVVPAARGRERSRSADKILREVRDLAGRGFKDITLLGQNVNSYGHDLKRGIDFVGLLKRIVKEAPGLPRLRFMTSHPKDAHTQLLEAMRDLPMVCPHLHLPVQSGSDRILKRMKRRHTIGWFYEQVELYRRIVPGGSLTTDLIVGFPGETDEDFGASMKLVKEIGFDDAYIFKYSPRPGTPAARIADDVIEEVKASRHAQLLSAQRQKASEVNHTLIGKTFETLFEYRSPKGRAQWIGTTRQNKRVVVRADEDLTAGFRSVTITGVSQETLLGKINTSL